MGIKNTRALLKASFAGITAMIIVITLFSLLIPSTVRVSRAVVINNTDTAAVFLAVSNLQNWTKWHPVFTKQGAELNCSLASPNSPPAICTIIQQGRKIEVTMQAPHRGTIPFTLRTEGENEVKNEIFISQENHGAPVFVEWRSLTKLKWYPWRKVQGIFLDKLAGPGYEAALNGLKEFIENNSRPLH
jgi:hypothetical protein